MASTKYTQFTPRIRSRHPSHSPLRRNKKMFVPFKSIVRFGSSSTSDIKKELNSIEGVKVSSSKLLMKAAFKKAGVFTPEYSKSPLDSFPQVAKKNYGSRGRGMKLLNNKEELDKFLKGNTNGYYYEEYFNGCREYRLHISALGCFYACRKMRKTDAKERWFFNNSNCVWFLESNEKFDKPKTWNTIIKHCQKALIEVGLDFAAFDVRVNKKGEFRLIECNSAPSLATVGIEKYENHIPKLLKHKYSK